MKLYGLTGGSGTGKSTAAQYFTQLGWGWVNADTVYRQLCVTGSPLLNALQHTFGDILLIDGSLNRPALAGIVFSDPSALAQLNAITRPYIWEASQVQLKALEAQGICHTLYDAPTLFQTGLDQYCDGVIGVIAPRQVRIERIQSRDNLSFEAAAARIDAQPDCDFYRTHCQFILENKGTLAQLVQQVRFLCQTLLSK